MRRVVVTGIGVVSPLGVGAQRTWTRLLANDTGTVSLATHPDHSFAALPSRVAGLVPLGNYAEHGWTASEWLSKPEIRQMPLFTQYAASAATQALADASWHPESQPDLESTGVSIGTGIGALSILHGTSQSFSERGHKGVSPHFVPQLLPNLAAGHLSIRHGLMGPNLSVTSACTTGAHALSAAFDAISHPRSSTRVMLAGAAESCMHPLAVSGFARARALSTGFNDDPASASRPFDVRRDGFVMGEGAAVLVLEELEHARGRGARVYAELKGHGESGDAHHATAPRADGRGAVLAMRRALAAAGVGGEQVGWVNAHATGTPLGDAIEARAIKEVFGEGVCVSSVKGGVGHLLGAAGAFEAVCCVLAIRDGVVPGMVNLEEQGEDWGLDLVRTARQKKLEVVLSNSFGFGGTNASLVFTRLDD